jgi:hypothetical protein
VQTEVNALLYIILFTKGCILRFEVLKAENVVVTKNNVFWAVVPCDVEEMADISEDCQYISAELHSVTSRKTALFIVLRQKLKSHIVITDVSNVMLCWRNPLYHSLAHSNGYGLLTI